MGNKLYLYSIEFRGTENINSKQNSEDAIEFSLFSLILSEKWPPSCILMGFFFSDIFQGAQIFSIVLGICMKIYNNNNNGEYL